MRHSEQKKVGKPDTEKAASGQAEKAAEQAAEKAAEQARNVNIDVIMRNKLRGSAAHVSFGKKQLRA